MQRLQGLHLAVAVLLHILYPTCSSFRSGNSSHVRYLRLNRRLSQIAVVMYAVLANRRIDNQINLAVCDKVKDIWTPFIKLVYLFSLNACASNKLICTWERLANGEVKVTALDGPARCFSKETLINLCISS